MLALSNQLLDSAMTGPEPVAAPVIQPASAPVYVAPVSVPMLPGPTIAPPPPEQFRGEGGTSFGLVPQIYILPPAPVNLNGDTGTYVPPPNSAYNPATPAPALTGTRARPGDKTIQPVPSGQVPTKPDVAPAVVPVPVPGAGPVKGTFLGFELAMVPLWAWLVGAALLGARVLR